MKKAYPAAALAVVLWGTAAPVCKLVLDGMSEMALLFYSSLVSFLLLLALNLGRKKTNAARRYTLPDYLHMAALGFLGLFLYNFLYYRGMSR